MWDFKTEEKKTIKSIVEVLMLHISHMENYGNQQRERLFKEGSEFAMKDMTMLVADMSNDNEYIEVIKKKIKWELRKEFNKNPLISTPL